MTQMRWWWLAAAMSTVVACGDTAPGNNPPPPGPDGGEDVVGDVKTPDVVVPTDTTPPPDGQPPADGGEDVAPDVTPPTDGGEDVAPDGTPPPDGGPTCMGTETRCGDICVDLAASNSNCGMCGTVCPVTQTCRMGTCMDDTPCPMGQARCSGMCVDTQASATNCGACGNACMTGQSCIGGTCQVVMPCPTGQTRCGSTGACVDTMTDANNCGTCGTVCMPGQSCTGGMCTGTVCMTGQTACGGACVNTMTDVANCGACGTACMSGMVCTGGTCGAMPCPTGETRCGTTCVNTTNSPANCGMCGRTCATGQTCTAGVCTGTITCPTGQTACGSGAMMSCADLMSDTLNCGVCGTACTAGQVCTAGRCTAPRMCPTGQTDCTPTGMAMTCFDLQSSNANCGSCGTACPTGQTCTAGVCTCGTGTTLCGRACVNLTTDITNCGACGTVCPMGRVCTAGACACATGTALCGGSCVNTMTDRTNCGTCGNTCPTGQSCVSGACACPTGQMACSGVCVNTATDRANCGRCGNACISGQTCTGGTCACPTGQMACTPPGGTAACIDTMTSSTHCGRCNNACAAGTSCMGGTCRGTPPANDTRAGATVISLTNPSQTLTANTTAARNDTTGTCGCTSGNDVFFRFTLTQPEIIYADTLGSTWDTSLFIQTAPAGSVAGTNVTTTAPFVACNDDSGSSGLCGIGGLQTQIAVRLAAGSYYLVLSGCGSGTSDIHFQHLPAGNGASVRITPSTTVQAATGTTSGVGTVSSTCCSGGADNSHWWLTCPGTAAATFNATSCSATTGANLVTFDIEVAQYSALRPGAGSQVCNDDTGFVCGVGSTVTSSIPTTATNQVGLNTLVVDACSGAGAYTVNYILSNCTSGARCGAVCADTVNDANHCGGCNRRCPTGQVCAASVCVPPPANDLPGGAVTISNTAPSSTFTVDTRSAANNTSGSCGCTSGGDVFYNFTVPTGSPRIIYADTLGSNFDTSLFVQTSTGTNVTATNLPTNGIACNDDNGLSGCGTGLQSQILMRLEPGAYRLVLSGCGRGMANLRFHQLPVGNGAVAFLNAGSSTPGGTTSGTGRVTGSCSSSGPENTYYWYRCASATTAGTFTASTCGRASWDTSLHQSSAARTTPGLSVCNDDSCGLQSSITSTIPAGAGLHTFYVDGFSSSAGAYTVSVSRP